MRVRRRTPVILVTGIDDDAMASAVLGMAWDLPDAAVMRHTLDLESQRLTRLVSDQTGVVEHVYHDLEHACVACALREDIVPTLERLAASGRWGAIVAHLPVAAEALQVCRVIAMHPGAAPHVRVSAVVSALDGPAAGDDLLGDELLSERGLQTSDDDTRGVAEAHATLIEYADAIVVQGAISEVDHDLVRALARPGAVIVPDATELNAADLMGTMHDHRTTERWVDVVRRDPLPQVASRHVWTMELRSDRPFHPDRLLENIEILGGGPRRSRGCFWLPTRSSAVCAWEGAGGQLSVGCASGWGRSERLTRIVVTGVEADDPAGRDELARTFEACLLTDAEIAQRGLIWDVHEDGLEPWLGEIRRAA